MDVDIYLQGGEHGQVDQAGVGAEHAGVGGATELAGEVGRAGKQIGGIRDGRREHLSDGLVGRGQCGLGGESRRQVVGLVVVA